MSIINGERVYIAKVLKKYEVILVDLDDTLVDMENINFLLYKNIFNKFGVMLSKKEWKNLFNGKRLSDSLGDYLKKYNQFELRDKIYNYFLKHGTDKKLRMLGVENIKLTKIGRDIIKILKQQNKSAILCTMSKKVFVDFLLDYFNVRDCFDFIISGDDVKNGKPHPEIYKKAKKLSGRNKKFIVIEDSVYGLMAGLNAECDCLLLNNSKKICEFYEA